MFSSIATTTVDLFVMLLAAFDVDAVVLVVLVDVDIIDTAAAAVVVVVVVVEDEAEDLGRFRGWVADAMSVAALRLAGVVRILATNWSSLSATCSPTPCSIIASVPLANGTGNSRNEAMARRYVRAWASRSFAMALCSS
jgi:hypothetical protein